ISSEAKSAISTLQRQPKPYYTIQDVESLVENLKTKMQTLNKEAHVEFSKKGLRGLDITAVSSLDDTDTLISKDELETIKRELNQCKEKVTDGQHLRMRIEDLEILLSEKESEITNLKNQSGLVSGKVQDQIKNLNLLQEELDEAKRVAKQEKKDREKMEAEFETVGNALMSTRLEIEELQQALGNKDMEIENLKSEVQILSNNAEENIILKERQEELKKKIEKQEKIFSEELDAKIAESSEKIEQYEKDVKNFSNQLKAIQSELKEYKKRTAQLEQENEDLLLDSGETSQEAVALRNKLEEIQQTISEKEDENRNLNIRLEKSEKERQAFSEEITNRKHDYEELKEKYDQINQELSRKVEDLEIELKGKEERIQSIEKDRNELREILSAIKIEREKQKSFIVDLETQLTTKDHELSERSKDLDNLRKRQAEIAQEASESRAKHAEIERERDNYESKIKSLQEQLKEKDLVNERLENRLVSINSELETKEKEISTLNKSKQSLESTTQNLKEAVETLRINLAKNPKYAILFILQDIQQASVKELAKTVAIQKVFAERLMKELKEEGWVSFDEISGTVKLKKALLELDY
ncbi:MAG: hypothetical protein ACFFAU_14155, partial [Candidatus Hodarchaeota archaeon]